MISCFTGEYRWLSNFWPVYVTFDDIRYPSVEHAYQAAKSADPQYRLYVQMAKTAREAKTLGQMAVLITGWDDKKFNIMYDLIEQKFSIPYLRDKLLSTGDSQIIEGNYWHDTYWGVCSCSLHRGEGDNYLGRIIMDRRSKLRK